MIETERLILKPVTIADFDLYFEIMSSPLMSQYLPKAAPYNRDEVIEHVAKRIAHWERGFGSFIVYSKADPSVKLGYAAVETSPNPQCCDIRYGFIEKAQGKGYGFEAAKAVLDYTFKLGKHLKIYGVAIKENTPSIKILEKLGMKPDCSVIIYNDEKLVTLSVNKFV